MIAVRGAAAMKAERCVESLTRLDQGQVYQIDLHRSEHVESKQREPDLMTVTVRRVLSRFRLHQALRAGFLVGENLVHEQYVVV